MSNYKTSNIDLVGNTLMLELVNYEKRYNLKAKIVAKCEFFNPAGSTKDRAAKEMILDAERKGLLKKGGTIIEPTSGNTGIGLASIGVSRGYSVIIIMPDTMSKERIKLIKAYGADVILTDGKLGMKGAIDKAEEIKKDLPNSIIAGQFDNPANWMAHYKTTGPEIYNDMDGEIDYFVSAVGTGGTITGVGKYLKEKNPNIKVIAVEPESSPFLSKGVAGAHKIQGIGAGFVPKVLDTKIYDEIITITNEEAYDTGRELPALDGILVGISSGAALMAARKLAERKENENKTIVVLLPDSGDRYLSTEMFD